MASTMLLECARIATTARGGISWPPFVITQNANCTQEEFAKPATWKSTTIGQDQQKIQPRVQYWKLQFHNYHLKSRSRKKRTHYLYMIDQTTSSPTLMQATMPHSSWTSTIHPLNIGIGSLLLCARSWSINQISNLNRTEKRTQTTRIFNQLFISPKSHV